MPRVCTICSHEDREAIDQAIVGGSVMRQIATDRGVTESALRRHRDSHVSPALVALQAERDRDRDETLLDRVESLIVRTEALLDSAEAAKSVAQALAAVRELRALLELLGRATGELRPDAAGVTINLLSSDQWQRTRDVILVALAPHPDARMAVAHALAALDDGVATPARTIPAPPAARAIETTAAEVLP